MDSAQQEHNPMIYPTITIDQNQFATIDIYDIDIGPVMSISNCGSLGESFDFFYTLLSLFINQYVDGFEEGYATGLDDTMEGVEDY